MFLEYLLLGVSWLCFKIDLIYSAALLKDTFIVLKTEFYYTQNFVCVLIKILIQLKFDSHKPYNYDNMK